MSKRRCKGTCTAAESILQVRKYPFWKLEEYSDCRPMRLCGSWYQYYLKTEGMSLRLGNGLSQMFVQPNCCRKQITVRTIHTTISPIRLWFFILSSNDWTRGSLRCPSQEIIRPACRHVFSIRSGSWNLYFRPWSLHLLSPASRLSRTEVRWEGCDSA